MAYDVIHKNSTAAGTPPTAAEVELGEIAINAADAELYVKDASGNIRKFQNTTTGTAAGVQFTQAGTGAVQRTVESKLQDVVHIADFNGNLSAAIDATPAGGILQLGAGPYRAKFYKARSDITIRGIGMPSYANDNLSLVGGTIIQGSFHLNGNRITIENLGVDCGQTVCATINNGDPMEGLRILDPSRTYLDNIVVRDVIVLGRLATDPHHCYLFEGVRNSRFENLHSRYNQWGIVFKTQNSTADGLYAYASSQAAVTVKSDSYAIANTTQLSNVSAQASDYTGNGGVGILFYAATADSSDVCLKNFQTSGFAQGVKTLCDTRSSYVNVLNHVTLSNGIIRNAITFGLESYGAVSNLQISNLCVYDTTSGNNVKIWPDCLGANLSNVTASAPSGVNNLTNVDLAGRVSFDQLLSFVDLDTNVLSGINVVTDTNNRSTISIGTYRGNLYVNGVAADVTLANGWTEFFSTVTIRVQSGRSQLYGRVSVPATPWTGKETIGTIPAELAPFTGKYFLTYGWAGTSLYPVYVSVSQAGTISCDFLNTSSLFPSTITHVGLDGISWLIPE